MKVVAPQPVTSAVLDECFQPFVFDGFVSLTGRVEKRKAVKILRDSGDLSPSYCPILCLSARNLRTIPAILYRVLKWVLYRSLSIAFGCRLIWSLDVSTKRFVLLYPYKVLIL